jgi:transcriptional regulator GlxA family with amidase domain
MAGMEGYLTLPSSPAAAEDDGMSPREVLITLYDDVQSLDVTGPLEVFAGASRYQEARGGGRAYRVRTASRDGAPVTTSSGLTLIPDGPLAPLTPGQVDTLVVPGGRLDDLDAGLVAWLAASAPGIRRVTSVCTGAFVLAEAGLLDGRQATTHWAFCADLARRYPGVRVLDNPIYVTDGPVVTSAGVTAGIDLALALVEDDIGRAAALAVARHLVVFLRRPGGQAQFSAQLRAQAAQRRPLRDVQQWITEHPADDLSVDRLAARASLSPRQFARAFAAETGVPPGRHVAQTRLEAARRMLEDGAAVEQVARACGYGSSEAMRRAFVKALGVPPASYRTRF